MCSATSHCARQNAPPRVAAAPPAPRASAPTKTTESGGLALASAFSRNAKIATGSLSPLDAHRLLEAAADRDVSAVVGRGLDVDLEGARTPPSGRPISAPQLRIPWHLAEALRRCGRLLDHPPQRRRALATGQRRPLVPGQPVATGHALRLCVRPLAATQSDSAPRRPPRLLLAGHFALTFTRHARGELHTREVDIFAS